MTRVKAVLVLRTKTKACALTRTWEVGSVPRAKERVFCGFQESIAGEDAGQGAAAEIAMVRWDMPVHDDSEGIEALLYLQGRTYPNDDALMNDVGLWKKAGFDADYGEKDDG